MTRILFVCHGNILKSPGKASKINGFTKHKGAYYTTTTPFFEKSLDVTSFIDDKVKRRYS